MLRTRALEFSTDAVRMRFSAEDDQLISLVVIPADSSSKSTKLSTVTGSERRASAKSSIKSMPNGDVLLSRGQGRAAAHEGEQLRRLP
jgi:hypothetical protein